MVKPIDAEKISFSRNSYLAKCYIHDGYICYNKKKIIKIDQRLTDRAFLLEDVMASICAVSLVKGISPKAIREQLNTFEDSRFHL